MVKGSGKQQWGERGFWRALVMGMRNPSERQWWWDTLDTKVLTMSMFCSAFALVRKSRREEVTNNAVLQAMRFYPLLPSPRAVLCPAAGRLLRDGRIRLPAVRRARWLSRRSAAFGRNVVPPALPPDSRPRVPSTAVSGW